MTRNALYAGPIALGLVLLLVTEAACAWDLNCRFEAQRSASIDSTGATSIEVVGRAGALSLRPATSAIVSGHGRACASNEEYLQQTQVHARREGDVIQLYVQTPDSMSGL